MDSGGIMLFLFIGLVAGNIIGTITWRLPLTILQPIPADQTSPRLPLWLPGTRCCECETSLAWYDNIPLFSWLRLQGKCRHCGHPVCWHYLLLEVICIAMAVLCYALHPQAILLALALFLYFWFALALSAIDIKHYLLPDRLTLPLLWLGLLFNTCTGMIRCEDAIAGAAAGYIILWLIYWVIRLIWHKEGLGYGDFKMLAAVGAWSGWQSLPIILYIASIAGVIYGLLLWLKKGRRGAPIPFGPALALSGWGYFCWISL